MCYGLVTSGAVVCIHYKYFLFRVLLLSSKGLLFRNGYLKLKRLTLNDTENRTGRREGEEEEASLAKLEKTRDVKAPERAGSTESREGILSSLKGHPVIIIIAGVE